MSKLSISEAAARLGVSEKTIRRKLHRGELQGERQSGKWFVLLSDSVQDTEGQPVHPNLDKMMDTMSRLIEKYDGAITRVSQLEAERPLLMEHQKTNEDLRKQLEEERKAREDDRQALEKAEEELQEKRTELRRIRERGLWGRLLNRRK